MSKDSDVRLMGAALPASRLYTRCDPALFDFETTAELPGTDVVVGQARALEALDFGVRVGNHGYNLFVLGRSGSQRHRIVEEFLKRLLDQAGSRHAREILLTGEERTLDRVALERQLRSQAARACAHFEAATSRLGLHHRFEVTRGDIFAESLQRAAAAEALVVSLTQTFAGSGVWPKRFARQLIEARLPRVLLARQGWFTGQSIAVLIEDIEAANPALEAAARIAKQSRSPITALIRVRDDTAPDDCARRIADTLRGRGIEKCNVILLSDSAVTDIVQAARACRARLLVIPSPTEPDESEKLDELLRRFTGAVMLVRQ